jgi:hypothetical protein
MTDKLYPTRPFPPPPLRPLRPLRPARPIRFAIFPLSPFFTGAMDYLSSSQRPPSSEPASRAKTGPPAAAPFLGKALKRDISLSPSSLLSASLLSPSETVTFYPSTGPRLLLPFISFFNSRLYSIPSLYPCVLFPSVDVCHHRYLPFQPMGQKRAAEEYFQTAEANG